MFAAQHRTFKHGVTSDMCRDRLLSARAEATIIARRLCGIVAFVHA